MLKVVVSPATNAANLTSHTADNVAVFLKDDGRDDTAKIFVRIVGDGAGEIHLVAIFLFGDFTDGEILDRMDAGAFEGLEIIVVVLDGDLHICRGCPLDS